MPAPIEEDGPATEAVTPAPSPPESESQSDDSASYRRIFKATSIIGGASVLSIVVGILRTKVFALLLGPAGIGLLGLLNAFMAAAVTVAQMGIGTVGTRQIAEAHATGDLARIALARRALVLASIALAAISGATVWLLREPLALHALRDARLADAVGWIGVGTALSVAALAQVSLLQGMRRMRDLALLQIGGALLFTLAGLPLVWVFGLVAVPIYILLMPVSSFVLGHILVARLERLPAVHAGMKELGGQWRMFFVLGLPMMGAAAANTVTMLWIQSEIKRALGIEALGIYVASNTIAMQYMGIVLTAMAGDYYPRLTGIITDAAASRRLVNQQTEVALSLAGPLILVMFAAAPWVIQLLYSSQFAPASDVLRWQVAGTLLKVLSWPMGFILLAAGAGRVFFLSEVATLLVMAGVTALCLDRFGVVGAGIGYFVGYAVYLPLIFILAAPRIGLRWSRPVLLALAVTTAGLAALTWAAIAPSPVAIAVGVVVAGAASAYLLFAAIRTLGAAGLIRRLRRGSR